MMNVRFLLFVLGVLLVGSPTQGDGPGSVLEELTTRGIFLIDDNSVILDTPIDLSSNAFPDQKTLSGSFGWRRFSRDSVVAPIWIDLDYLKNAQGDRIGHSVRFRFVVHASLVALQNRDLMRSLFGGEGAVEEATMELTADELANEQGHFHDLSPGQITEASITTRPEAQYGYGVMPLMNQVVIRGVLEAQSTKSDKQVILAWRLMNSIEEGSKYSASWSSIDRNEVGRKVVGLAKPYQGAGGYVSIQPLGKVDSELTNACLIEGQIILHEPSDWFGGSNFLRSKFPLLLQEASRTFRRGLKGEPQ